ncbi:hypothetical protein BYT27DRAFT_7076683, partial [Phlegmacium glaucopus]
VKGTCTLLLPQWYELLEELKLNAQIMPWDVSTRWNSTYDMIEFATEYCLALDTITSKREMKL